MSNEIKTVRLTTALTPTEAEYIKRTAEINGMSVSEFIHEVLVGMAD